MGFRLSGGINFVEACFGTGLCTDSDVRDPLEKGSCCGLLEALALEEDDDDKGSRLLQTPALSSVATSLLAIPRILAKSSGLNNFVTSNSRSVSSSSSRVLAVRDGCGLTLGETWILFFLGDFLGVGEGDLDPESDNSSFLRALGVVGGIGHVFEFVPCIPFESRGDGTLVDVDAWDEAHFLDS